MTIIVIYFFKIFVCGEWGKIRYGSSNSWVVYLDSGGYVFFNIKEILVYLI